MTTIDLSEDILVEKQLAVLVQALAHRSDGLKVVVGNAVKEPVMFSADVGGMATGIRFQDRTKRRPERVFNMLQVIGQALEAIRSGATAELSELAGAAVIDPGG